MHKDAATVQVVGRLIGGEIIPVYSREIMHEYREVLSRKKFKFEPDMIDNILLAIEKYGIYVEPSATGMELPDRKDLPFYEWISAKMAHTW